MVASPGWRVSGEQAPAGEHLAGTPEPARGGSLSCWSSANDCHPSLLNFMIADIPQSHSMEQAVAIMTGALATGETPGDPR
jgi:hypothetical protein